MSYRFALTVGYTLRYASGMTDEQTTLLADIDRFLAEHEMSPITFGRRALRDPHFVRDLRGENGRPRRVWPETEAKVRHFMATARPDTQQVRAA